MRDRTQLPDAGRLSGLRGDEEYGSGCSSRQQLARFDLGRIYETVQRGAKVVA